MASIRFRLNGVETDVDADPDSSLLAILRGQLGMTGPHFGCGANECGACNVIVGDHAVAACDTPLWSVAGKDITTIEGLGSTQAQHPRQRAFIAGQSLQCGYCVSGILMSAAALLKRNPAPSPEDVKAALDRNLCRCGSHNRMVRAVLSAAAEIAAPKAHPPPPPLPRRACPSASRPIQCCRHGPASRPKGTSWSHRARW